MSARKVIVENRPHAIWHSATQDRRPACGAASAATTVAHLDDTGASECPLCAAGEEAIEAAQSGECPFCGWTPQAVARDRSPAENAHMVLSHVEGDLRDGIECTHEQEV